MDPKRLKRTHAASSQRRRPSREQALKIANRELKAELMGKYAPEEVVRQRIEKRVLEIMRGL